MRQGQTEGKMYRTTLMQDIINLLIKLTLIVVVAA